MARVKEISVFVDESGSFSPADADLHAPFYLLCMVFHDQSDDISQEVATLGATFEQLVFFRYAATLRIFAGKLTRDTKSRDTE